MFLDLTALLLHMKLCKAWSSLLAVQLQALRGLEKEPHKSLQQPSLLPSPPALKWILE